MSRTLERATNIKRKILENEKTLSDIKKRLNTSILHFEMSLKKDLDGKLHGVNENTNIIQTRLDSLDKEDKNNTQNIFDIHENIRIQTEQVQKLDDERQQSIAKAKEDLESNAAYNEKAISDLKKELAESITNIEITLKQDKKEKILL